MEAGSASLHTAPVTRARSVESRMDDVEQDPNDAGLDDFIQQLTASQSRLRAYILASLGNLVDTADVLQRTNLALWKNARRFRPDAEFLPWAVTLARYEILSFYRDRSRDRHVFSEDVALMMLDAVREEAPDPDDRQAALRECLEQLPAGSRELLTRRYSAGESMSQIAETTRRSENAVKCAFVRIRKALAKCIETRLRLDAG